MKRVKFLRFCLILAMLVIVAKLFQIQILQHDDWVARADAEHTALYDIIADRGEIYMMDGEEPVPVVLNTTVWTVIVDPYVANKEKTSEAFNSVIKDKLTTEVDEIFADRERRYFVAAKNITRDEYTKLREKELLGVYYKEGNQRVYTEGNLAASTLGFVNADGVGQYGVEGALNSELAGKNGLLKTVTDVNQVALSIGDDNVRIPAEDGEDIVLTIDRNIQKKVEKVLQDHMQQLGINHSAAMVMEPGTGRILAMANYPTYDPANFAAVEDATVFQNNVLEDPYEPGSICKSLTMAAAINEGKMTADTTYINEGSTTVDGWKIDNADTSKQLGEIPMRTALAWSLNTGSIQALRFLGGDPSQITQAGKDLLYNYFHDHYKLGEYTGVELIENPGVVVPSDSEHAYNSTYANMTFGQGLNVTMVQVASAFSSIINGGNYHRPTVVAGHINDDGVFEKKSVEDPIKTDVVTAETSATMRDMLHGTRWYMGDPEGYYYGGKTGTAQAIRDGAYVMDEFISGYVGFGGASGKMPQYVIIVKMWEKNRTLASDDDVRPVFEDLKGFMNEYLRIKPGEGITTPGAEGKYD